MSAITDPQTQSSYPIITVDSVAEASIGETNYNQRILPRQLSSGALRGTQNVGYGDVKIDGSNNQITIGSVTNPLGEKAETIIGKLSNTDSSFGLKVIDVNGTSVTYGLLSDGSPGMEITDSSGKVIFKMNGNTWYWYDDATGDNVMQVGLLPDGTHGWVVATPGNDVSSIF